MSDILYSDLTYCALCDRYFPGEEVRAQHVQYSENHPRCDTCDRRFANMNSLRNHWVLSPRHHWCSLCDKEFSTAAGLRIHIDFSLEHNDPADSDEEEDPYADGAFELTDGWEDEFGRTFYPEEDAVAEFAVASDDESYTSEDEYWDEDYVDDLELEEAYQAEEAARAAAAEAAAYARGVADAQGGPSGGARYLYAAPTERWGNDERYLEEAYLEDEPLSFVQFNCPLCLEAPRETSATRCGHVFCTPCINLALRTKNMCPVCRKTAWRRQLRRIFLSA